MNSVSMPRRPPSRACAASSETTVGSTVVAMGSHPTCEGLPGGVFLRPAAMARRGPGARLVRRRRAVRRGRDRLRGLLVGPVAVPVEEVARGVLGVAVALAADPDAHQEVEQPDGQA